MPSLLLTLGGRIASSILMFLRHPLIIYKTNKRGKQSIREENREYFPPYKMPKYEPDMKYCTSKEKYLRPVHLCEPNVPDIIAMANSLGAFEVGERKYAENVFHFVKNNIRSKNVPVFGALKTLKKGYGSCFDAASLFITLCRCGRVKARYKIYLHRDAPPGFRTISDVTNEKLLGGLAVISAFYTVAEVEIDGKWLECEVSSPPELDAFWNVPIARFGETVGTVGGWIPANVLHLEKLPLRVVILTNFMFRMLAGTLEAINHKTEDYFEKGKIKLEKIGRKAYDKKSRRRYGYVPSLEE